MDVVTIEKKCFETIMGRLRRLSEGIEALCRESDEKRLDKWLDNQDVCTMLQISLRTLQTYRENGTLPYSQIGHKIYYRSEDVAKVLENLPP